jgi:hypothetical protein
MSFKPNYIENNGTEILDPKISGKTRSLLPEERKNRKKKYRENLTSFDG